MNETLLVFERGLCQACAEQELATRDQSELHQGAVARRFDPTVCAQCGKDGGSEDMPLLMKMPICEECGWTFRHRPYPGWLKASFVGLLVLLAVAMVRNYRFFAAYVEMRHAQRAFSRGDIERAADLMGAANEHVPENAEIAAMAGLFRGVQLLAADKARRLRHP